jgi:hypothetical protein
MENRAKKKLDYQVDEGWVVHIYGRNRRLLCALEPLHGWIYLIGVSTGLLFSVLLFNIARPCEASSVASPTSTTEAEVEVHTAPLMLD